METILITGSAGFIGYTLGLRLLERNNKVIGVDNHNNYYDVKLKNERVKRLKKFSNYNHIKADISNFKSINKIFKNYKIQKVVNLAAQAGVRYSIENPLTYINSNITGFAHILENCRTYKIEHLVYASTSSVYGSNTKLPFSENNSANHPLSVYAASKKSNELMAHAYSHLYKLPSTGLRFFTVYGPWGRPDMALFKFTKNILENKPIDVFNFGNHTRDFTYIDDIVDGIIRVLNNPATSNNSWNGNQPDPSTSKAPWKIYNIGNNKPVKLMDYITSLEKNLKKKAIINYLPLQQGDVADTNANINKIKKQLDYNPLTKVEKGVTKFVEWYKDYFKVKTDL